ncbi:MAG: hypothetical protein ACREQR_13355 [Candidatus Binataceae bacterium]
MSQERQRFSSGHRAAPMSTGVKRALATFLTVAVVASMAVVGSTTTSYAQSKTNALRKVGTPESIVVTNNGALFVGTIETFAAGSRKNTKPVAVIKGATGSVPGLGVTGVPAEDVLAGVAVNPNPVTAITGGTPVNGAIYVASDLSIGAAGAPDSISGFPPGTQVNGSPIAFMITLPADTFCLVPGVPPACEVEYPGNPIVKPEGIAFLPLTTAFESPFPGAPGDYYVTQLRGGELDPLTGLPAAGDVGSVLEYAASAGTAADPIPNSAPVGEIEDLATCTSDGGAATLLFGPVGVARDSSNNIWVVNSGLGLGLGSYVTEYPAGSASLTPLLPIPPTCVTPIGFVGAGVLEEGEFDVISPIDGGLWVSDVLQNAVFEFDPDGDGSVVTEIAGKRSRLKAPMGVAMNAEGDLYVANNERNQVLMFEDPSFGGLLNVKPNINLHGNRTGLHQPVGVALGAGVPPFPSPTATPTATSTPTATATPTATPTPPPG